MTVCSCIQGDADDCVLMCSGRCRWLCAHVFRKMQMTVFSCIQGDADDCVLMYSGRCR